MRTVVLGSGPLTIDEVVAVARAGAPVQIAEAAWDRIAASRSIIDALADDTEPHYGVSTGFGALATRHIPVAMRAQLQRSLVRSHAAGSGPEVEREVVRALMLLRLATLATGRTGVRPEIARTYLGMLNAGITPVVHEYGSLGCSGDLAPLSHCALALMGEGNVRDANGQLVAQDDRLLLLTGHRRHARDALLGDRRPANAVAHRRYRDGDECRGAARHRSRLRRRPSGDQTPTRTGDFG